MDILEQLPITTTTRWTCNEHRSRHVKAGMPPSSVIKRQVKCFARYTGTHIRKMTLVSRAAASGVLQRPIPSLGLPCSLSANSSSANSATTRVDIFRRISWPHFQGIGGVNVGHANTATQWANDCCANSSIARSNTETGMMLEKKACTAPFICHLPHDQSVMEHHGALLGGPYLRLHVDLCTRLNAGF
jgi:hypothetical protein